MARLVRRLCPSANHPETPLISTTISSKCVACYEDHHDNTQGYKCSVCKLFLHEECLDTNIPSRHTHPLKLNDKYLSKICSLCHTIPNTIIYECSICSFCICIPCARKPLVISKSNAHDHELHQLPIQVSFTCYACGLCITEYPCFCLQCRFIIHRVCISLPRVIRINRHDHRISRVSSLGPGNWDAKELEGVPEKDEEERKPFEVIDHIQIKHFSHEHNLKVSLSSSRLEEPREHCYACTIPLYSELCYTCTQCDFILHDACTNLPLKKRHDYGACGRFCTGFSYMDKYYLFKIDVRCALISGAIKHESHPHLLVIIRDMDSKRFESCDSCDSICWFFLRCSDIDDCDGYNLCFRCATLPTLLRYKYDDHPLSLCYEELYPKFGFTNEMNVVQLFILNVLKMGYSDSFYLLPNHHLSRPICYLCKTRCMGDFFLNDKADANTFICCSCMIY
ncbi:hypothetical protein CARUB_v10007978mg [Capsella rubella]|uniref:Phorbol-ester/DAG-type domain-containing protein n=1 Tax=Capsella rubella TaxID=81985 RepID=R0GM68_9BRAS|nr:hypothetical protein CARUB_v10007978mg [Capsella rubella]